MKKNDQFSGKCIGYTVEGLGIVKHEGFVFFVKNMLRDEEGDIVVTAMKKSYGFGKCLQLTKMSEHRVEPKCSIVKHCGGCQIQHMDRSEQQYFKHQKVVDCFKSIAKMEPKINDVIDMEVPYRYRNKVQVPVQCHGTELKMGFYRNNTNDIVEFEDCLVQTEESNQIVQAMKKTIKEYNCGQFFKHVLIKHAHKTNEIMVVFIVSKYPFDNCDALKTKLLTEFPQIKSILVNINNRNDNVILTNEEIALTEQTIIQERLHELTFNISSKSFYQINPDQTQVLYDKAIEYAKLTHEDTVVDLYCGTGTIGLFAAQYAKKVIGIEIVEAAVIDAKVNATNNNISNIEFICADAKEGAKELLRRNEKIDVVIVDPPRKGCDESTLESIVTMNPKRIVYVSCDPSTLARDCALLAKSKYQIEEVQPVDMFPLTHHVESVVLLNKVEV